MRRAVRPSPPERRRPAVPVRAAATAEPPSVVVGRPGSRAEREADRVAAGVLSLAHPTAPLRPLERVGLAADAVRLHTKRAAGGPSPRGGSDAVAASLRAPGRPLEPATRRFMEPRLGADLRGVRVHTDARAARAVDARAFTAGAHIVFDDGEYAPRTDAGRRLLAHELVHVVQQGGEGPAPNGPVAVQRMPRQSSRASCPGTKTNWTPLASGFTVEFGVGHPENTGDTSLRIMSYDESGDSMAGSSMALVPGESKPWYHAKEGAAWIGFFCEASSGTSRLTYDVPIF